MCRCYAGASRISFCPVVDEGGGDVPSRIQRLLTYVKEIEVFQAAIMENIHLSPDASSRCKHADQEGGMHARMLRVRDQTVRDELIYREQYNNLIEVHSTHHGTNDASPSKSVVIHSSEISDKLELARVLHSASTKEELGKIDCELRYEDSGINKLSKSDRIVADRTSSFVGGEFDVVNSFDKKAKRRNVARRKGRNQKKDRRRKLQAHVRDNFGSEGVSRTVRFS